MDINSFCKQCSGSVNAFDLGSGEHLSYCPKCGVSNGKLYKRSDLTGKAVEFEPSLIVDIPNPFGVVHVFGERMHLEVVVEDEVNLVSILKEFDKAYCLANKVTHIIFNQLDGGELLSHQVYPEQMKISSIKYKSVA